MSEYISRSTAKEHLLKEYPLLQKERLEQAIASIPAADVRPVVHGEWIDEYPNIPNDPRMICSVCGKEAMPLSTEHFCPNCGAQMEGA